MIAIEPLEILTGNIISEIVKANIILELVDFHGMYLYDIYFVLHQACTLVF